MIGPLRVAALVSGGKDSLHAAWLCETHGWTVEALVTLEPSDRDSFLFHTPNLSLVPLMAQAWRKPHLRIPIAGRGEGEEVDSLVSALAGVRELGVRGITVGAIGSSYQWSRFWAAAKRAGLEVFAPLWRATPLEVVREEISAGLDIRFSAIASEGLSEAWLGQRLDGGKVEGLLALWKKGVHVAGEGGDYETAVLDAPYFDERIEVVRHHVDRLGGQSRWAVDEARLVGKAFSA